jgi:hypothetical protein
MTLIKDSLILDLNRPVTWLTNFIQVALRVEMTH